MDKETSYFVEEGDLRLEYFKFGQGSRIIIAMHGHGKHASDFEFLAHSDRKIISINLFLHGKSEFGKHRLKDQLITHKDVEKLLEKILEKEKIGSFEIIAYSQGGRFVLSILPYFITRVKSLILLAPDGLNDRNFYSWSQRRWWARLLFKRWTQRPKELLSVAGVLAKGKIIHPKIVDFLQFYSSDSERFKRAFHTWYAFRKLRPNERILKSSMEHNQLPFKLVIGKYDKIITEGSARGFLQRINKPYALILIDGGHDFFREDIRPLVEKEVESFWSEITDLNG
jgi:pimeloyl-ACP methyl ester carboxylesterase